MVDLKTLNPNQLVEFFESLNHDKFRARQLMHWIYQRNESSIDGITEFSVSLRQQLAKRAYISNIELIDSRTSKDATEKFLFGLSDGEAIEGVLMPDSGKSTLCVSTQVGCAMGCRFCRTGSTGFKRNLNVAEIVDQIILLRRMGRSITNVVLMGMGEPLANIKEVSDALRRMTTLMGISPKRITLSTVGLVEGIEELPLIAPPVNLAVSLNAPTNEIRNKIMPINRRYPIEQLIETLRAYPIKRGRRITFEYVLLRGVNDSEESARMLSSIVRGIPCKINLIPFNAFEDSPFESPGHEQILRFQEVLIDRGYSVFIRKSRGQDIAAACGQLRGNRTGTYGNRGKV